MAKSCWTCHVWNGYIRKTFIKGITRIKKSGIPLTYLLIEKRLLLRKNIFLVTIFFLFSCIILCVFSGKKVDGIIKISNFVWVNYTTIMSNVRRVNENLLFILDTLIVKWHNQHTSNDIWCVCELHIWKLGNVLWNISI